MMDKQSWVVTYITEYKSYDERPGVIRHLTEIVKADNADEAIAMIEKYASNSAGKMSYDFKARVATYADLLHYYS